MTAAEIFLGQFATVLAASMGSSTSGTSQSIQLQSPLTDVDGSNVVITSGVNQTRLMIDAEEVLVTAAAAGATTITVTRGQGKTAAVPHLQYAPVLHKATPAALSGVASAAAAGGTNAVQLSPGSQQTGAINVSGQLTASAVQASGAAPFGTGRFLGSLTSAPTSGTYTTGDWAVNLRTQGVWFCTEGGTPGTWKHRATNPYKDAIGNGKGLLYNPPVGGSNQLASPLYPNLVNTRFPFGHPKMPLSWDNLVLMTRPAFGTNGISGPAQYTQVQSTNRYGGSGSGSGGMYTELYYPWLRSGCDSLDQFGFGTVSKAQPTYNIGTPGAPTGSGPYSVTFPTTTNHDFSQYSYVTISGNSISGYNGSWLCTAVTASSFTISTPTNLGTPGANGTAMLAYGTNIDWWQRNHPGYLYYTGNPGNPANSFGYAIPIACLDFTQSGVRSLIISWLTQAAQQAGGFDGVFFDNGLSPYMAGAGNALYVYTGAASAFPGTSANYTQVWAATDTDNNWIGTYPPSPDSAAPSAYIQAACAAMQDIAAGVKRAVGSFTITTNWPVTGTTSGPVPTDAAYAYANAGFDMIWCEFAFTNEGADPTNSWPLGADYLAPFMVDGSHGSASGQFNNHFSTVLQLYVSLQKEYGKGLSLWQAVPYTHVYGYDLSTLSLTKLPTNWTSDGSVSATVQANRKIFTEWCLATYSLVRYHHTYMSMESQYVDAVSGAETGPNNQAEYATYAGLGEPTGDYYTVPWYALTTSGPGPFYPVYARDFTGGMVLVSADPQVPSLSNPRTGFNTYTVDITQLGPAPGKYTDLWSNSVSSTVVLYPPGNNPGDGSTTVGAWNRCSAVLLSV